MKNLAVLLAFLLIVPIVLSAMDYEELARYWAPVIYQDTDPDPLWNPDGKKDYITKFNYDDNYNGNDNSDNVLIFPLTAYIYFDVRETETHYYITYAFFHPCDRSIITLPLENQNERRPVAENQLADTHENDLEGVVYCIKKNGSMGILRSCVTICHLDLYTFYIHPDPGIVMGSEHLDTEGPNDSLLYIVNSKPVVFIEEGGHGVGNIFRALESDPDGDISFDGVDKYKFRGDDGIIYRLVSPGGSPQIPYNQNDRDVRYDLLSIEGMWNWQIAPPDGNRPFSDDTFDYTSSNGCHISYLKRYFDSNDLYGPAANPPWAWGGDGAEISDGDFFLDPAFTFSRIFPRFDDTDIPGFGTYIRNDYFSWGIFINISSPGTGETWFVGDKESILWNTMIDGQLSCGLENIASLEISRDGGVTWSQIGTEQVLAGFYLWTVEGPASSACQIRVVAQLDCDSDIPVYSEAIENFNISSHRTYYITANAGSHGQIEWSGDGYYPEGSDINFTAVPDPGYEVEYWRLDGIIDSVGGNTYMLENIQKPHNVYVTFNPVENKYLQVLSPNGSEVLFRGRKRYITWESKGNCGDSVKIDLYKGGIFDSPIIDSTPNANDGVYKWSIPYSQPKRCDYQVMVSSLDGSCSDMSDGTFCIQPYVPPPPFIEIKTADELQKICSDDLHPRNAHYLLMNDIDARACGNFDPIGSDYQHYFRGTFDGQGYTISRLEINRPGESYIGLFSVLMDNGIIKNLTISDDGIYGLSSVGALVGESAGTIINCHAKIDYLKGMGGSAIGGLVGENVNSGVIQNCSAVNLVAGSNGKIRAAGSSPDDIGGLVGLNSGRIEWCWTYLSAVDAQDNEPEVNGYYVGGLVGRNYGTISECYSNCVWIDSYHLSGGVVGYQVAGSIVNCHFSGANVNSDVGAGGIAGMLEGGTINRCYVNGHVQANGGAIGALIGENYATVSNSFWNRDRTGVDQPTGNGGTVTNCHSKITSEMMQQATFTTLHSTDWDFDNVWVIAEGTDFPRLRGVGSSLPMPSGLVASTDEHDGVHLSWDSICVICEIPEIAYEAVYKVYRSDYPDGDETKTDLTDWQIGHVFNDDTAVPGAIYYYRVKAAATINEARISEFSDCAEGQRSIPPADTPTGVFASDSLTNSVFIEWDNVSNANYYQVYRSDVVDGVKDIISNWQTGLSHSDQPPEPDTAYYYWVRAAKNGAGEYVSEYGGPDTGYYIELDDAMPEVSASISPDNPVETQICSLHVLAEDNDALQTVALYWAVDGIQDSLVWDDVGSKTLDVSHSIGAFPCFKTVAYWATALDASDNKVQSDYSSLIIQIEVVSQPSRPEGPQYLQANQSGLYLTGGSETSLGSSVQYRFSWTDTFSSWGDSTAAKAWSNDGKFTVKTQARSLTNFDRESDKSEGFIVIVDSHPPTVSINTNNGDNITTGVDTITISGESIDRDPSSGIVSTLISTGSANTGDNHNWSFHVESLAIGLNEIVVTSADNAGNTNSDMIDVVYNPDEPGPNPVPEVFALYQNIPNPFNPETTILFDLPQAAQVKLSVYNVKGELVATLVDRHMMEGRKEVNWIAKDNSGRAVSSGIYFYRLVAGDFVQTKKMVLLR